LTTALEDTSPNNNNKIDDFYSAVTWKNHYKGADIVKNVGKLN
jgi:hypothetical protein